MQTIKTICDICKKEGDRYPSWFDIEREKEYVSVGSNIVQERDKTLTVNWIGWKRYEKFIDLCDYHRDQLVLAIQSIVDKDRL